MQANSWRHKLFHFHLPFWVIQKFEYLENEKKFLDEIKNIFHKF